MIYLKHIIQWLLVHCEVYESHTPNNFRISYDPKVNPAFFSHHSPILLLTPHQLPVSMNLFFWRFHRNGTHAMMLSDFPEEEKRRVQTDQRKVPSLTW